MSLPSVMSHQFSRVPQIDIERSTFDRSCGLKTTFDAGKLVPIFCDEVLPGDTLNLRMATFARVATLIHPLMDNLYLDSFFFFIPNRLVWDNWERFNGAQDNPGDSTDFTIPQMVPPGGGNTIGSLSDYFGLPVLTTGITYSSMWHRAYNLVFNEWFRDQNLIDSLVVDKDNGPDNDTDYVLKSRGKRHDYFTSCLPFLQKGPDIALPLGASAPVLSNNQSIEWKGADTNVSRNLKVSTTAAAAVYVSGYAGANAENMRVGNESGMFTDLTAATGSTINSFREAVTLQQLFETDARGGTRYTEIIKAHFGVTSPDARLQRPEYLGGGSSAITINPVAQTSETNTTDQAELAAYATASFNGHGFSKAFTEHGMIIGLVSVRADLTYQQGLPRMFSRLTRFDFYQPAFAHLGEQAVLNQEIYADGSANDLLVFGYQERYAEYRYKGSLVTGQMRSDAPTSLDVWHVSQDFSTLPTLGETFITEIPPLDRVTATPSEPHMKFDAFFSYKCARPMPVYGVPGLTDRF